MYGKRTNKQNMRWGAAGQCLLILLSFLPVWLLSANDVAEATSKNPDSFSTTAPPLQWTATSGELLPVDVPRP